MVQVTVVDSLLIYSQEVNKMQFDWFMVSLICLGLIVLGFGAYVFIRSQYRFNVVVRELTGNGAMLISFDRAKRTIDKEANTETWKLWKEKVELPPPPQNAVEIDTRGRKFAEVYKLGDYEFAWVVDDHTKETIRALIEKDAKSKGLSTMASWKSASASSKFAWLNQTKKAFAMKGKGLMDFLMATLPFILLIVVLVVGYMMWDSQNDANKDITKMMTESINKMTEVAQAQTMATQQLLDKMNNVQVLTSQTSSSTGGITNGQRTPPN